MKDIIQVVKNNNISLTKQTLVEGIERTILIIVRAEPAGHDRNQAHEIIYGDHATYIVKTHYQILIFKRIISIEVYRGGESSRM